MPQRKSAKKEMRKNLKRRLRNLQVKKKIKLATKKFKKSVQQNDLDNAKKMLPEVYKVLDKAASKGVIHPNKAARQKSRLTLKLQKVAKTTTETNSDKV